MIRVSPQFWKLNGNDCARWPRWQRIVISQKTPQWMQQPLVTSSISDYETLRLLSSLFSSLLLYKREKCQKQRQFLSLNERIGSWLPWLPFVFTFIPYFHQSLPHHPRRPSSTLLYILPLSSVAFSSYRQRFVEEVRISWQSQEHRLFADSGIHPQFPYNDTIPPKI